MPFNTSMPLLYINKEAFVKAGLDPSKPPTNLDEIWRTRRSSPSSRAARPFSTASTRRSTAGSWSTRRPVGKAYCDNDNGRKDLATKVNFDQAAASQVATWYQQTWSSTAMPNTGKKTDDAQAVFKSGTVAMHLESTGSLRGYLDAAKGKFTLVTAPYPNLTRVRLRRPDHRRCVALDRRPGHTAAEKRAPGSS